MHYQAQRFDEAARAAEAALALTPDDGRLWEVVGLARQMLGDLEGAIAAYDRAIELMPGDSRVHLNRGGAYIVGHQQGRAGWRARARADFERAVELDPRSTFAWNNLGWVRAEEGDVDGAIAAFRRTLELDPNQRMAPSVRKALEDLERRLRGSSR